MKSCKVWMVSFLCLMSSIVSAGPIITDLTGGGGPFGVFYGGSTGDVVGFSFFADDDLTVSALGIYGDSANDNVLNSAHDVGLWAIDGTLLGSANVDSNGFVVDGFYYETITTLFLSAGSEYVLGAVYATDDEDAYFSNATFNTANISGTQGVFAAAGNLGFVFPSLTSEGNSGRVGPNMIATVTSVSTPGTLAMFALGLALVGLRRKK